MLPRLSRSPQPYICEQDRGQDSPLTFFVRPPNTDERTDRTLTIVYSQRADTDNEAQATALQKMLWKVVLAQVVRAENVDQVGDRYDGEALRDLLRGPDVGEERIWELYKAATAPEIDDRGKASSASSSSGAASPPAPVVSEACTGSIAPPPIASETASAPISSAAA